MVLIDFNPGNIDKIKELISDFSLDDKTRPQFLNNIKVEPLDKWQIEHPLGKELIMEKISFPSLIKHEKKYDKAIFYVYRHGELRGKDVILWVPGMAVSDFAFLFIKKFFYEELKRGFDIVFYVPPFHMERKEEGEENGQGLFTANTEKNVQNILNSVKELRTVSKYLENQGVRSLGGWGGSIGASMLLLMSQMVKLDHLCMMVPIINWETVMLNNPNMKGIVDRLNNMGFSEELLLNAYDLINPINYQLNINPNRVHIMSAEYDQLTPPNTIIDYARKNSISNITSYKRSHATILLSVKLYKDCGEFLDTLQMNTSSDS